MKLRALDKSTMSANNKNQQAQSGYYYAEKMHKDVEGVSANIPLETVTVSDCKSVNRRNSSSQLQQVKYIQCILPFLCILQVINIVSVSVCFYMYKVTLDDYTSAQTDIRLLQYKYEAEFVKLRNQVEASNEAEFVKMRNEIEANVTAQIREIQQVASNLSQAKSKIYDYDAPDYDNYDEEAETDTARPPPPPISEEPDNQPPTSRFRDPLSEELTRKVHQSLIGQDVPMTSSEQNRSHQEDKAWNSDDNKRQTRSIHLEQDPYEGINPDRNDAEGDYRDIEPHPVSVHSRLYQSGQVQETVAVLDKEKKHILSPKLQVNHTEGIILSTGNQTHNSSQLNNARSLKHMEETLVALRLSWEQSRKEQPTAKAQQVPPLAVTRTIAIHLVGDTSKYKQTKEKHYDVNYRMYHPKGHIKDWRIDTLEEQTNEENFKLENGHLKVQESGLYFVYAQIYYSTKEDTSGFNIFLNDNVMLRCIKTGVSSEQMEAAHAHATAPNSCYTAALMRILPGDKLSIKETQGERFTIFEPTRSFFGLFKVG